MGKAFGILACAALVAASMWMSDSRDSARTASAQENRLTNPQAQGAAGDWQGQPELPSAQRVSDEQTARELLVQANRLAAAGDVAGARRLAKRAASYPVAWKRGEQTPSAFLSQLDVIAVQPLGTGSNASRYGGVMPAGTGSLPGQPTPPANGAAQQFMHQTDLSRAPGAIPLSPPANVSPAKQDALRLLQAARDALNAGRHDDARRLAMQAQQLNVPWTILEERPEHVLAAIARQAGGTTFLADSAPLARPTAGPAQGSLLRPAGDENQKQAIALLAAARRDIQGGNFAAAREKALQAKELSSNYPVLEDRPELVLADIDRLSATASRERGTGLPATGQLTQPSSIGSSVEGQAAAKNRALALLEMAREDLRNGRLSEARQKVAETVRLDVPYGLFDDRPELVAEAIDRAELSIQTKNGSRRGDPASAGQIIQAQALGDGNPTGVITADGEGLLANTTSAADLIAAATDDMKAGRYDAARRKALEAQRINAAKGIRDERIEIILGQLDIGPQRQDIANHWESQGPAERSRLAVPRASANSPSGQPNDALLEGPAAHSIAREATRHDFTVINPAGVSALELYSLGVQQLREGDRESAYQTFQQAYQSGEKLDVYRTQQLQDFLRDLSAHRNQAVTLAAKQGGENQLSNGGRPGQLEIVEQEIAVKYDRLRSQTMNAIFRAERLREQNPKQAIELLDRTLAEVEGSELNKELIAPMSKQLNRSKESVEAYISQHKSVIETKERSEDVKEQIVQEQRLKGRIEQDYAGMVDEYNKLMDQRRFPEAEIIAKKARDLDPENPVSEVMFWKVRFARRTYDNDRLKEDKEESFINQLREVDLASINDVATKEIKFPKDWKEITGRRDKHQQKNNRKRTEKEEKIQKSLSQPINLHFEKAPLREILQHISTTAGVDVFLDDLGLQDVGMTSDWQLSIDVDGVMLKSALNLLLEPLELAYTIQDEVLKVTSKTRQQGELVPVVYPVADLVVPIPNFPPAGDTKVYGTDGMNWAPGAGNFSVPSTGGLQQRPGQGFAQVNGNPQHVPIDGANRLTRNGMGVGPAGGAAAADFDTLSQLIISTVEPGSWSEVGGEGTIEPFESTLSLVIRATERTHEDIALLLEQLRRLQDLQVAVEVRFITVTDRFFERIGVDFDFNIQDNVGPDAQGLPAFGSPRADDAAEDPGAPFTEPVLGALNLPALDAWPKHGTIVGLSQPDQFSTDLDVGFRQGSFNVGVPDFGGFNPDAGIQVGLAILSDLEAFFFIQAAQGDERANLMFAPKVTMFNGQWGSVSDTVSRPFVTSLIPTVGVFAVGFTPVITTVSEGVSLSVQAVISADRRFVRLTVIPIFSNITDVFTFSFVSSGQGGTTGITGAGAGGLGGIAGAGGFGGGGGFGGATGFGGIGGTTGVTGTGGTAGTAGTAGDTGGEAAANVTVQQPVVEQVTVTTTVSVPDGGTVLLGGIKRLREGRNMAGVPILNKIPYVSRLFKNSGVGRETESLMLMVTPRIIIQEEEMDLLESGPGE
ncbi:MAG: hypothetical protein WD648_13920 [Planctomycetaceae bacterium]